MSQLKRHDLFNFMAQLSCEVAAEYERVRIRASDDPGTAGDQGEENWATVFKNWLPPTYQIVTKGRLIGHDGTTSPQVDIVVLKPSYPRKLLDKKLYLAAGVAAAFECKITLTAAAVKRAVETAVAVKSLFPARKGSPYRELRTPIIYGLLAHSHSWKRQRSRPLSKIEQHLYASDLEKVQHPRLGLDLMCVADLGTWIEMTTIHPPVQIAGHEFSDFATTGYLGHSKDVQFQSVHFTPVGVLIAYLIRKLAWEDPGCRDLANYYREVDLCGSGSGPGRLWPTTIYSEEIRGRVVSGKLSYGVDWDEWSQNLI